MICNCPVCRGRSFNSEGLKLADTEVLPFVKDLLKVKVNHPLPYHFYGLTASLFAYSQALAYDRAHSEPTKKYYTENPWMMKIAKDLNKRFPQLIVCDIKYRVEDDVREVCELNVQS